MRLTFTPGWVSFTPKQMTKYPNYINENILIRYKSVS